MIFSIMSDPCNQGLLPLAEALRQILSTIPPIEASETVPLKRAANRVLSENLAAPFDLPAFSNSAMDGYAFCSDSLPSDHKLTIDGTAWAGKPYTEPLAKGQCVRIFTGAAIPAGCDTVIMQEEVERHEHQITLKRVPRRGENVRPRGSDLGQGDRVLTKGQRLGPAELGLLACLGVSHVRVFQQPRVGFFSTGDELKGLGEILAPGQLYDSNRYSLHGLLSELPVSTHDLGTVPDRLETITELLSTAGRDHDIILSSGGASVGDADLLREALASCGQINLWKIAIKPGKPLIFGKTGNAWLFGLPGNPVSVHVTFCQIIRPALWRLAGAGDYQPLRLQARCANSIAKTPGRMEFQRGRLSYGEDGFLKVTALAGQGSHQLASLSRANCFIILPSESKGAQAGQTVEVEPFEPFMLTP